MRTAFLLLNLVPAMASATPQTLAWSGRLLDVTGEPLSGDVDLTVRLFNDASGDAANQVFDESFDALSVTGGYASVVLGASDTPLDDSVFVADSLWVQVAVDDRVLGDPRPLHSAPYAHTASRLGAPGVGLRTEEGTVVVEGDLTIEGTTRLESVQIGERHVLTIEGNTCTNDNWEAVIGNDTAHTLIKARMSFSHCEDGCHHAYREWIGFFNSYTTMVTLENTTSYGSNAGTWSMTRNVTDPRNVSKQTTFRKSADPTHAFCGDVNVWIESNRPLRLISQSDG